MSRKIDLIASVLAGEKPGSMARLSARRLVDALEAQGFSIVPTPKAAAPADVREAGAQFVCRALDAFQKEYEANTRDRAPGNDYWAPRLLAIVEAARASLSLPPAATREDNHGV